MVMTRFASFFRQHRKLIRWFRHAMGIALLIVGVRLALHWFRYEINLSESVPIGLYAVTEDSLYVGQMVAACLPEEAATFAQARGYLGTGECPDSSQPVLKRILAMEGDIVEVQADRLSINGIPVVGSQLRTHDGAGREIPALAPGTVIELHRGELWLHGSDPMSYDSRYYGVVMAARVIATAYPVATAVPAGMVE